MLWLLYFLLQWPLSPVHTRAWGKKCSFGSVFHGGMGTFANIVKTSIIMSHMSWVNSTPLSYDLETKNDIECHTFSWFLLYPSSYIMMISLHTLFFSWMISMVMKLSQVKLWISIWNSRDQSWFWVLVQLCHSLLAFTDPISNNFILQTLNTDKFFNITLGDCYLNYIMSWRCRFYQQLSRVAIK